MAALNTSRVDSHLLHKYLKASWSKGNLSTEFHSLLLFRTCMLWLYRLGVTQCRFQLLRIFLQLSWSNRWMCHYWQGNIAKSRCWMTIYSKEYWEGLLHDGIQLASLKKTECNRAIHSWSMADSRQRLFYFLCCCNCPHIDFTRVRLSPGLPPDRIPWKLGQWK
jgi:hypothetical protein